MEREKEQEIEKKKRMEGHSNIYTFLLSFGICMDRKMCVCVYIYIYIYTCKEMYIDIRQHLSTRTYTYISILVYKYWCEYMRIYAYVSVFRSLFLPAATSSIAFPRLSFLYNLPNTPTNTPKSSQCPLFQPCMVSLDPGHAINIHQSDPFYFLPLRISHSLPSVASSLL